MIELVVPFAAFGPRRVRLATAAILTLFQLVNTATPTRLLRTWRSGCTSPCWTNSRTSSARRVAVGDGLRSRLVLNTPSRAIARGAWHVGARVPRPRPVRLLGTRGEQWRRSCAWRGRRRRRRGIAHSRFASWVGVLRARRPVRLSASLATLHVLDITVLDVFSRRSGWSTGLPSSRRSRERARPSCRCERRPPRPLRGGDTDAAFRPAGCATTRAP